MYEKMKCAKCGSENLKVIDSRPIYGYPEGVRRRRQCRDCGERRSFYELPEDAVLQGYIYQPHIEIKIPDLGVREMVKGLQKQEKAAEK